MKINVNDRVLYGTRIAKVKEVLSDKEVMLENGVVILDPIKIVYLKTIKQYVSYDKMLKLKEEIELMKEKGN